MSTKNDPRHIPSPFKVNDIVKVFDGDEWLHCGDIGDNSCYYKPATITKVRKEKESPHEWLADVLFDYGQQSNGHFQSGIKLLMEDPDNEFSPENIEEIRVITNTIF